MWTWYDSIELILFVGILALSAKPLGLYMCRVFNGERVFLTPLFQPLEIFIYRIAGIEPDQDQSWTRYCYRLLTFSAVSLVFTYLLLRLQHVLPFNPQGFAAIPADLAFNTAVSFTTNTNWQSYGGESTMSYFSQAVALTFHNFVSAAVGISVAVALIRGLVRKQAKGIGCFWADLLRSCLYILLPLSFVLAIFLLWQGVIQNFLPYISRAFSCSWWDWVFARTSNTRATQPFKQLGAQPRPIWKARKYALVLFESALFATVTTDASCGAVNSMHDSFTPIGGLVPLLNIELGEIVFGGVGAGLYGMMMFILLTVFIAGLMVGRTPEYLGKRVEGREIKYVMLALIVMGLCILGFSAWGVRDGRGLSSLANAGPHGFSEVLYAFSSATGNNGSAFGGLSANTPFWNITLGVAMFFGRFLMLIPMLAVAGSMARKRVHPGGEGTFPTEGLSFIGLLIGVILILGALIFFPALALGPIAEHFEMLLGHSF